ncbi:actin-related protein 8 [Lingula anatina]|uniref:Actin-related protein 8 n=1 Tax=Lingula anatina TaxID=7574 RepID=A0A1S3K2T8_LINAN|nr:actin-related protein 8 [Lingula anatina]|eukprot:XP_013416837.1 actin-related protein 8 [Lingula anatina]
MPPTSGKRPFPQSAPEPPQETFQGTTIIVIHPGSLNLRIGRAADTFPVTIPHCIARRHEEAGQTRKEEEWVARNEAEHPGSDKQRLQGLKEVEECVLSRPMSRGEYRQPTNHKQLCHFNNKVKADVSEVMPQKQWTSTQTEPDYVIGEEALFIHPQDCYTVYWPMRRGHLNIHSGPAGSLTAVMADLETIWGNAIEQCLDIPMRDFKHYRIILLIPDIYNRQHVREMVNMLLDRLGFAAVLLHQESVCAVFGAGVPTACVVDMGDQKTSVCCVEDGVSQVTTRVCMEYGGSDISRTFHWLLKRAGFPYKECNLKSLQDAMFIQELKERQCHLDQDMFGSRDYHFQIKHPGHPIVNYSMQVGDETILAAMSPFFPDLLGLKGAHLVRLQPKGESDPADIFDDDYLAQTQSKQEQAAKLVAARKKGTTDQSSQPLPDSSLGQMDDTQFSTQAFDEDSNDAGDSLSMDAAASNTPSTKNSGASNQTKKPEEELATDKLLGLEQAILHSIEKCDTEEVKKKMYSCIVVVGGGLSLFKAADSWLQYRVWVQMPAAMRLSLETMDVITNPKELDPRITCWKGAAIMSCLDTSQEMWIRQREWRTVGPRLLRERAAFVW